MPELTAFTARGLAALIAAKHASPREVVQAHLDQIEQLNPQLNALVCLNERAREEAKAAEAEVMRGLVRGPLHGVPLTIKSSIDVAGLRCETGTPLRKGYVAEADATLVARLKAAGAIILGNTNVAELLMAYESENPLYGRTNSPWDLARTPGGSSGGEAAAIAAGCSAGGVGSDGGGSVRVPAHFSGICGLKPTPGRIPSTGHFPSSGGPWARLGVVGPMARTVGDVQLLFEVMAGLDWAEPSAAPVPLRQPTDAELRKLRIGYFEDDGRVPVTAETRAAVRTAAEALRDAGFDVVAFRPEGLESARRLWELFFCRCGELLLREMLPERAAELPILKEYLASASAVPPLTSETLLQAWLESDQLRVQVLAQMEQVPVLLCPVASIPAFRHGERAWQVEGRTVRYLDAMSYTQWFNLLGFPAMVLPVGHSPEGLPIGIQVVGRPYEEEVILALAARIEQACGGWQEPPLCRRAKSA